MKKIIALFLVFTIAVGLAASTSADERPHRIEPILWEMLNTADEDELIPVWGVVGGDYHKPEIFPELIDYLGGREYSFLGYESYAHGIIWFVSFEVTKSEAISLTSEPAKMLGLHPFYSEDAFHQEIYESHTMCTCAMCHNCNCISCVCARGYEIEDEDIQERTVLTVNHTMRAAEYTIFDALEILKYLIDMDNVITECSFALQAAIITDESIVTGEPTIFDVLEILKSLVGMPNKLS